MLAGVNAQLRLDCLGNLAGDSHRVVNGRPPLVESVLIERNLNDHVGDISRNIAQLEDLCCLDLPDNLVCLVSVGSVLVFEIDDHHRCVGFFARINQLD